MKTELQINVFKSSRFAVDKNQFGSCEAPAGSPERECMTRALPPCLLKGVATGAQMPLHSSIISTFMIYHYRDRIEANFLWFLL